MRLDWVTDIHLNCVDEATLVAFGDTLASRDTDALMITGDIAEAASLEPALRFIAASYRKPVYFVLGNHDFYGSRFEHVHTHMKALCDEVSNLNWMPYSGIVGLTPEVAIIGHGGWYDARIGHWQNPHHAMSDWSRIGNLEDVLQEGGFQQLVSVCRGLGDFAANRVRDRLAEALQSFHTVIILTHVPPFSRACQHRGSPIPDPRILPWYTCKTMGDSLMYAAELHPDNFIAVFCGHAHGASLYAARENLVVRCGSAEYGNPQFQQPISF